jgi:hypothetical protein
MSERAPKKRRSTTSKGKNRGGQKKVAIDPSTNIFQAYKSWGEVPYELKCIVENASAAFNRYWIWNWDDIPLVVQQDKDFTRNCIIRFLQSLNASERPLQPQGKRSRRYKLYTSDWDELPLQWKQDSEVALAALQFRRADWEEIPRSVKSRDDFMRKAVIRRPDLLTLMPDHIRNDKEYWLSDQVAYDYKLFLQLWETLPDLNGARQFWLKMIQHSPSAHMDLFEQYASLNIRQDREIVLAGCTISLFEFTSLIVPPLSQDEDFIREVCQGCNKNGNSHNIAYLPFESQRLFPHLLIEYLFPVADPSDIHRIDPELWRDLDFAKAWMKHDGGYLEDKFPESWKSDPDLFLWIASDCPTSNRFWCFQSASEMLRSDKAFMVQVLRMDPTLFPAATLELQEDIDLQMLVCSKISDNDELAELDLDDSDRQRVFDYAQEKMVSHEGFLSFLCCVTYGIREEQPIALLNQGPTTSTAYYQLVAEYLEVPTGLKLKCVRHCMDQIRQTDGSME